MIQKFFKILTLNKVLFANFFKNYNFNLISFYFNNSNNIYFICNFWNSKYNWINSVDINNQSINYLSLKGLKPKSFSFNYLDINNSLNNVIILKKKSSIFKKSIDVNYANLNKLATNKNNFDKNIFESKNFNYIFNSYPSFFKNFDLSRNFKPSIKLNRKLIKKFYNLKYYRNFSLTKNLKKYNNLDKKNLLVFLENRLFLILMRSDFFFNQNDCSWFIKNKLVSVNSDIAANENLLIKPFDIINISNNSYYYHYYKNSLDYLIKKLPMLTKKVWSINNLKFKNKKEEINYSALFDSYKYFKRDIPRNFEVDYVSMTVIILYYNYDVNNFDPYSYKFINLYLNRLYNWKFIN